MREGCSKRINITIYNEPTQKYCQITEMPKEDMSDKKGPFSFGMCSYPHAQESNCPIINPEGQARVGEEVRYLWD